MLNTGEEFQMGMGGPGRIVWALALAGVSAGFRFPADEPPAYPRSLGEIKAMVQLLAPRKGAGATPQNEFIAHLAQYRFLSGVAYENLAWDARYATLAYHGSLICSKLNQLTHTPSRPAGMSDAQWALCQAGAGQCNLYMGQVEPAACLDGWMDDSDEHNIDRVGHRRWCLNPAMQKSAFGSSGNFAAMYAWDHSAEKVPDWDFVAYPARGYMPTTFFGNRHAWSVSPNMGKYSIAAAGDVKVTITPVNAKFAPAGAPLKIDYLKVDRGGFGSGPAIIFRPAGFNAAQEAIYAVEIKGVKGPDSRDSIGYITHFVNLQRSPEGPEGPAAVTRYFQNRMAWAEGLGDRVDELEAMSDLAEQDSLRLADTSVRAAIPKALAELLRDPLLKREYEATQRYRQLSLAERKSPKTKSALSQIALAYFELSLAFKETRGGKKAGEDFERLKNIYQ